MKVECVKPKEFAPFRLTLAVETVEEARALYAIFNLDTNTRLLSNDVAHRIKLAIGDEHYVWDDVIANGVTYKKFYSVR